VFGPQEKQERTDVKYLVELPVGVPGGEEVTVGVEIEQAPDGLVDVSRPGQVIAHAQQALGQMLGGIRPVAESFMGSLAGMPDAPDEIGLEFGVSLSVDAKLVVATTATAANFKVALTWHRPRTTAPQEQNEAAAGQAEQ
jgi:hypothetical protein